MREASLREAEAEEDYRRETAFEVISPPNFHVLFATRRRSCCI